MLIPNNHWSFKYEGRLKLLCNNFFKGTFVNFFNFARFYKDGWVLNITTNNAWHRHYWEQNYIKEANGRLIEGINYWLGTDSISAVALDAENNFNIAGKIEIVNEHSKHIDTFGFGGAKEHKDKMINFYFNNIQQLQNFNTLFLSEFQNIIKNIEKTQELLPLLFFPRIVKQSKIASKYYNNTSKKLYFNDNGKDIILTMYQAKVLAFKLRGYSIESIAKVLNLKPDNINRHLVNIRKHINIEEYQGFVEKCIKLGIYNITESIYLNCLNKFETKKTPKI